MWYVFNVRGMLIGTFMTQSVAVRHATDNGGWYASRSDLSSNRNALAQVEEHEREYNNWLLANGYLPAGYHQQSV